MELTVNMVGVEEIVRSLQAQGKAAGLTVQHLAYDCMADACNDMVRYSPPRTGAGGGWSEQKKVGESAIDSDLGTLFEPLDGRDKIVIQNPTTGRYYLRPRRGAGHMRWAKEIEPGRVVSGGGLAAAHRANLGRRGRVVRKPDVHFARSGEIKSYIKLIKSHVGELKSGWLGAADVFCGLAKKKRKAPGWVVRHAEPSQATAAITPDGDGVCVAANLSRLAGAIRRDTISWVMRKRQRDLDKWLPKRAEAIAARIASASAEAGAVK